MKSVANAVEDWLEHENPQVVQKGRVLLKYLCKVGVRHDLLTQWLVERPVLYQKGGDLLLDYLCASWESGGAQYLVARSKEQTALLPLFAPLL